ncbi:hypothetical protein Btru_045849 [Bulinus truncatus]|nr:hypothetical protein Btru_045849 [Bulinus truncatus]
MPFLNHQVDSDGEILHQHPFAWNKLANMIYLEAPAGVGFSYSEDKNYTTDDNETTESNYLALQDFFRKFPEFSKNDFYITGESYGGFYVPTLVSRVLDDPTINLKGFAVGNPLSDIDMNDNSMIYFAYYHGLLGQVKWNTLLNACCPGHPSSLSCNFTDGKNSSNCSKELKYVKYLVWMSGLNAYNLYDDCHSPDHGQEFFPDQPKEKNSTNIFGLPVMILKSNVIEGNEKHKSITVNSLASDYPCNNGKNIVKYLNTISVRKALHIDEDVDAWDICNDYVFSNYKKQYKTMEPQYLKAVHRKLRILMYNGDVDMACNFLGDEWFVDSLGLSNPQERKMWHYKAADGSKQVAGFVKAFDYLTFVTIRGAGHQVPKEKPRQAYDMFRNFIQNKPF